MITRGAVDHKESASAQFNPGQPHSRYSFDSQEAISFQSKFIIHQNSTDGMPMAMPMVRRVWAFRHADTDWAVITGMSRVHRAETLRFCQARLPNRRFGEGSIKFIRFYHFFPFILRVLTSPVCWVLRLYLSPDIVPHPQSPGS